MVPRQPSLAADQLRKEGRSATAEFQPEPFGNGGAEVRERGSPAERGRDHGAAERQQRHTLARVVGRGGRRVVPVVGGNEQQIVLS